MIQSKADTVVHNSAFREYDIRGKVPSEIPIEGAYSLAQTIGYYFKQRNPQVKTIALGMDGRTHSAAIHDKVALGLTDSGFDVVSFGLCPSPVQYFGMKMLPAQAGIMITASHNPKEYNGFKMCLGEEFLWGKEVKVMRDMYNNNKRIISSRTGTYTTYPMIKDYIQFMVDHFPSLKNNSLSIVIDCGNGAAGTVMPDLINAFKWKNVDLLYPEVDGTYPHHDADPVVEKNMADVKKLLSTGKYDLGIGLDGDCDRMDPMTKSGVLVPGDQLLALFSKSVIDQTPGAAIICDIKSSSGLCELLETWGARTCMVPTGHASVKEAMGRENGLVGGELSCHFFFADKYFGYDDGIYAALRLMELLQAAQKPLDELLRVFPFKHNTPEIRIPCLNNNAPAIVEELKLALAQKKDVSLITIDGVRATMSYGWGIVRASNTQPVLSMRFEGNSEEGLQQVKQDFFELLKPHLDMQTLHEYLGK